MRNIFCILVFLCMLSACSNEEIVQIEDVEEQSKVLELDFDPQFVYSDVRLMFKSKATGRIFSQSAKILRRNGKLSIAFDRLPQEGRYIFLYYYNNEEYFRLLSLDLLDNPLLPEQLDEQSLGMEVEIGKKYITQENEFNEEYQLFGSGTEQDPFTVGSSNDLVTVAMNVNADKGKSFAGMYIRQECDIKLRRSTAGFEPIGTRSAYPFCGNYNGCGYSIYNVEFNNTNFTGWGLFGFVYGATIHHVNIVNPRIKVQDLAAPLVAVVMTPGDKTNAKQRGLTYIHHCNVKVDDESFIEGKSGVGGLVGTVDQYAVLKMSACSNNAPVKGTYGAGGLIGMGNVSSTVIVDSCMNAAPVAYAPGESVYSGLGGIVGVADTCGIFLSRNSGNITAPMTDDTKSVGGIVGGSGPSVFNGCINEGNICGGRGVGGVLGSNVLRITTSNAPGDETIYQSSCVFSGINSGSVEALNYAGGLVGEGQLLAENSYNEGKVVCSNGHAGGIVANSPAFCASNVANFGPVSGYIRCGGICGNSRMNHLVNAYNFSDITCKGGSNAIAGGIIGESGNNGAIHYCSNYGHVKNLAPSAITGGIAGMMGENKSFTDFEISGMFFAAFNMLTNVTGCMVSIFDAVPRINNVPTWVNCLFSTTPLLDAVGTLALNGYSFHSLSVDDESIDEYDMSLKQLLASNHEVLLSQFNNKVSTTISTFSLQSGQESVNFDKVKDYTSVFTSNLPANNHSLLERISNRMDEEKNYKRENEAKENSQKSMDVTIATTALAVAAIIVGIVSICAPGVAAIAASAVGIAISISSGGLSLFGTTNSFEENVSGMRQCANFGEISVGDGYRYTGALIGVMNDFAVISDSYNWGANSQQLAGGLVGKIGDAVTADRCVNFSSTWTNVYQTTLGALDPVRSLNNFKVYGVRSSASSYYGIRYCTINQLRSDGDCYGTFDKRFWDFDGTFPIHTSNSFYDFE